jgi:hypothetical protein
VSDINSISLKWGFYKWRLYWLLLLFHFCMRQNLWWNSIKVCVQLPFLNFGEHGRMRRVRRRPPSFATCTKVLMFPYHFRHKLRSTTCLTNDGKCAKQYKVAWGLQRNRKRKQKGMGRNRRRNVEERTIDWMLRWTRWDHQNWMMIRLRWRLITYRAYMSYFMYRSWACDTTNNAGLSALLAGDKARHPKDTSQAHKWI